MGESCAAIPKGKSPGVREGTNQADRPCMDEVLAARAADLSNQVSIAIAKKAMDADKEQGDAMVELIRRAMPQAPQGGHQGNLDLYA